jgi:MoaA/NifB/PqqE/SkfB family radical SAM enzyme
MTEFVTPERPASRHYADKIATLRSVADFYDGGPIPDYPVEISLELSNHCNLRCAMCVTFSGINPERDERVEAVPRQFMEFDDLAASLDSVLARALVVHAYGFGEATLHPQFGSVLRKIAAYEVLMDFFTNGTRLSENLVELLVELRVFEVTVSFSGSTAEEYENIYLGGRYEQVLAGMRRLADCKKRRGSVWPRVNISSVAFAHHIDGLDRFTRLMANHGAQSIVVRPLLLDAKIPQLAEHAAPYSPAKHDAVIERARAIALQSGVLLLLEPWLAGKGQSASTPAPEQFQSGTKRNSLVQVGLTPIGQLKSQEREIRRHNARWAAGNRSAVDLQAQREPSIDVRPGGDSAAGAIAKLRLETEKRDVHCMYPFSSMYIDAAAQVKPCCYANLGAGLGEVGDVSARDVWRGEGYKTLRTAILSGHYPAMCQPCLASGFMPTKMLPPLFADRFAHWFNSTYQPTIDPAAVARLWARDELQTLAAIQKMREFRPDLADLLGGPIGSTPDGKLRAIMLLLRDQPSVPPALSMICQGWFDGIINGMICGWAYSPIFPEVPLRVDIHFDDLVVRTALANRQRNDLAANDKAGGWCAFQVPLSKLPPLDGVGKISVRVASTNCCLGNSPIEVGMMTAQAG